MSEQIILQPILPNVRKQVKGTREHTFRVKGNVIDLLQTGRYKGGRRTTLYRRFFVSPEFLQLFYVIHDGSFDNELYERLTDSERRELSSTLNFLNINNREFNVALSKTLRNTFDRLRFIEAAIKAGNLSTELHDEYVDTMTLLKNAGMIPKTVATANISAIKRTLAYQQKK
jgi:hypothetical protein